MHGYGGFACGPGYSSANSNQPHGKLPTPHLLAHYERQLADSPCHFLMILPMRLLEYLDHSLKPQGRFLVLAL